MFRVCSDFLLITWPDQFNLLSMTFFVSCPAFVVPRTCSFLVLSLRIMPHIHRSIRLSFTSIHCVYVVTHVSASYSIAGLITVLPSPSVSLASFCRTVLQCISSNFPSLPHLLCDPRFHTTFFFCTRSDVFKINNYFQFLPYLRLLGFLVHSVQR